MRTAMLRSGLVAVAVLAGGWAAADIIGPGLNYMKTQPESRWSFEIDKLPSDFFEPGSEPFEGQVAVYTHTGVWHGASHPIVEGLWQVPTEIVAMTLHSVQPIQVTVIDPDTGEQVLKPYDVLVTLDPDATSFGQYLVTRDPHDGGPDRGMIETGPYDIPPIPPESFFDVSFQFTFTPSGRDPHGGDPQIVVSDRLLLTADVPWCAMAPPPYYHETAGDFFPGFSIPIDPHMPQTLVFEGESFTWRLRLEPIPEPTTLGLLALGALALVRRRRR